MAQLTTRKQAASLIERTFALLYDQIYNSGLQRNKHDTPDHTAFLHHFDTISQNFSTPEYKEAVNALDMEGFATYFNKFATLANIMQLPVSKSFENTVLLDINQLPAALEQTESPGKTTDILSAFSSKELSILAYSDKIKILYTILSSWFLLDGREQQLLKLVDSLNGTELPLFLTEMKQDNNGLLKQIFNRVNGKEKTQLLDFFDRVLIQKELSDKRGKGVPHIPDGYTVSAQLVQEGLSLAWYRTDMNGTVLDQKDATVSPFSLVSVSYHKERITVPALTFLSSDGQQDYLYDDKYLETLNFKTLSEDDKNSYFKEFVKHYLPKGFLSTLGRPLELIAVTCVGIIAAGLLPELAAAMVTANIALSAADGMQAVQVIATGNQMKEAAISMHELKTAAQYMAVGIARITTSLANIICSLAAAHSQTPKAQSQREQQAFRTTVIEQQTTTAVRAAIDNNPAARKTYLELIDQGNSEIINKLSPETDIDYILTFVKGKPRATTLFIKSGIDMKAVQACEGQALTKYIELHQKLSVLKGLKAGKDETIVADTIKNILAGEAAFSDIERAAICKLRVEGKIPHLDILIRAQGGNFSTLYQDKLFAWTSDPFLLSGQQNNLGNLRKILGIAGENQKELFVDIIVNSNPKANRLALKSINKQAISNGVKSWLEKKLTDFNAELKVATPEKQLTILKNIEKQNSEWKNDFGYGFVEIKDNSCSLINFKAFKQKYIDYMDIKAPGESGVDTLIVDGSSLSKSERELYKKAYNLVDQATGANIYFSGCDITIMPSSTTGAPEYGVPKHTLGGNYDIARINADNNGVQIFRAKINTDSGAVNIIKAGEN